MGSITHTFASAIADDATAAAAGEVLPSHWNAAHTIANDTVTEAQLSTADNTTKDVSTAKHGFVPKAPNDTTKFLRGDATWAVPSGIGSSVFGSLPAAASNSGVMYLVTDVGEGPGTLMISNGTRWKPVNGRAALKTLSAAVAGLTNSEVVSLQTLLPAGFLNVGDELELWIALAKSGATDTGTFRMRIGTAGTTGDTDVVAHPSVPMTVNNLTYGSKFGFKVASATTTQRTGAQNSSPYSGSQNTAPPAAVTISNVSNALYISIGALSSGATNTITIQSCQINLITP